MNYGYIPSGPSPKDFQFSQIQHELSVVPMVVQNICSPVKDQDGTNACVTHAITTSMERLEIARQDDRLKVYSPRFLYWMYNDRVNKNPNTDLGCQPRQALDVAVKYGVCEIEVDNLPIDSKNPPSKASIANALDNQLLDYYALPQREQSLLTAIATGYCFICGIAVFQSFEDSGGHVPMPDFDKEQLLGYHMIFIHDYDRHLKLYTGQNSWGPWGLDGHFTIKFDYIHNPKLTSDLWVIRRIE